MVLLFDKPRFHLSSVKILSVQVERANALVEVDKTHILNSIIGNSVENIDDAPLQRNKKYAELNDSLRDMFDTSPVSLRGAADE